MLKTRNECCGCPKDMGCLGDSCKNMNVKYGTCDDCGDETNELWYGNDGMMYCKYCITGYIEKVVIE